MQGNQAEDSPLYWKGGTGGKESRRIWQLCKREHPEGDAERKDSILEIGFPGINFGISYSSIALERPDIREDNKGGT